MDHSFSHDENLLLSSEQFTYDQIKNIINMRKEYEIKIRRKDKAAVFAYIASEKKILQKVQLSKSSSLTRDVILRILKIYNFALSILKKELMLWISYIKFCIETGNTELVTKSIPLLLDVHQHEEQVWHIAAKWETKLENTERALAYLYKGLSLNPTAGSIYVHIFQIILSNITENELTMKLKPEKGLIELFQKATRVDLDLDMYIKLLKISSEYDFTKHLQFLMCKFLKSKYQENEKIINILAERELEGHHFTEDSYVFVTDTDDRIKNCLKVYENLNQSISTEKMCVTYLDALVNLQKTYKTNPLIKEKFITSCEESHKKNFMTEKHYILWVELLENSDKAAEILEFATKQKPNSTTLWDARIRYHFNKNEEETINKIFEEAIKILADKSVPIWRKKIQYYQLKCTEIKKIEALYREALEFSPAVSLQMQPEYLEWVALFRSRDVVLKVYKELAKDERVCLPLHKKMAELEAMSSNPSEDIFNCIKDQLKDHPKELKEFELYVMNEICFGPTWKCDVFKKYLSTECQI